MQTWGQKKADGGEAEAGREYRGVQAEVKEECKSTDGLQLYWMFVFPEADGDGRESRGVLMVSKNIMMQ